MGKTTKKKVFAKQKLAGRVSLEKPLIGKKANKVLIHRALTDPKFRRLLVSDPKAALQVRKLTQIQMKEVELVLAAVKGIESQMNALADKLLCACAVTV